MFKLTQTQPSTSGTSTDRKPKPDPTRRIEQHHVLSSVDAAFLHERSCYLLRPLVKLHTGRRAHCYTLNNSNNAQIAATLLVAVIGIVYSSL